MRFSTGREPVAAAVSPEACRGDRVIGPEPRESLREGEGQAGPHSLLRQIQIHPPISLSPPLSLSAPMSPAGGEGGLARGARGTSVRPY